MVARILRSKEGNMGRDRAVALTKGIGEYDSLLGQPVQGRRFGLGGIEVILPAAVYDN